MTNIGVPHSSEPVVIGWRVLPDAEQAHYFKSRQGSSLAVSACGIAVPVSKLLSADGADRCYFCGEFHSPEVRTQFLPIKE